MYIVYCILYITLHGTIIYGLAKYILYRKQKLKRLKTKTVSKILTNQKMKLNIYENNFSQKIKPTNVSPGGMPSTVAPLE